MWIVNSKNKLQQFATGRSLQGDGGHVWEEKAIRNESWLKIHNILQIKIREMAF